MPLPLRPAREGFRVLPFPVSPLAVKRQTLRALRGMATQQHKADFALREYLEDVTLLDQIRWRARRAARLVRRREAGSARQAQVRFACTRAGRRTSAVIEALIERIESREAALA